MKIAGWIMYTIATLLVGALTDFNWWIIIPMALAFTGGCMVGYSDAQRDMRKTLCVVLGLEGDKHDEGRR